MPYSIECDAKGKIKGPHANKLDLSWFTISLGIYLFAALGSFKYLDVYNNALRILVVCDNYHLTMGLSFGFLVIVNDFCKRFKLVDLLREFNIFDNKMVGRDAVMYFRSILWKSLSKFADDCFVCGF